uniref:SpoU_methylase domain-containing protein n=1 Tax=Echinostoma caproni TaxID=27848 RepID=A0A183AK04_9TREM
LENEQCLWKPLPTILIVDNIRDPGNLGSLLRTAAGFGLSAVLVSKGSVDIWNDKVVRAGMSAHFRIPIFSGLNWSHIGRYFSRAQSEDAKHSLSYFPKCFVADIANKAVDQILDSFRSTTEIKKLLDSLQVKYRKLKLFKDVSFVTFGSAEDRDVALKTLNGHMWRGRQLEARLALGRADPLLQKRLPTSGTNDDDLGYRKRVCLDSSTPDAGEDEASRKTEGLKEPPVCPLVELIPSPMTVGYRNKSELTIGQDLEGKGPVIGFRFTKYRDGLIAVGSYRHLTILPPATVAMLNSLQEFINQYSPCEPHKSLTTYDPISHEGHWRQVLVRETRLEDRLLLLDVHVRNLDEHFGKVRFNQHTPFTWERLNTLATELLYEQIIQLAIESRDSSTEENQDPVEQRERVLLDVCCGTGTIGLSLAKPLLKKICHNVLQHIRVVRHPFKFLLHIVELAELLQRTLDCLQTAGCRDGATDVSSWQMPTKPSVFEMILHP